MLSNSPFTITVDDVRITVSVDRTQVDLDELLQFVDFLRLQTFLQQNTLRSEEISELADEIKRKAWQRIKRQLVATGKADFLPPDELVDVNAPVQAAP
jgi:hypothetical protein